MGVQPNGEESFWFVDAVFAPFDGKKSDPPLNHQQRRKTPLQEPTNSKMRAHSAWRIKPSVARASSAAGKNSGSLILFSAIAAVVLVLPILDFAAAKKARASTAPPVSSQPYAFNCAPAVPVSGNAAASTQTATSTPVFPGVPVTPSAQKTAAKAQPGQIIPLPVTQAKNGFSSNTQSAPAPTAPASVYTVKETRTEVINPRSIIQMSHDVAPGHTKLAHDGTAGVLVKTYNVTYKDGKPIKYQLISQKIVKAPVNRILLAGIATREARALPSRSGMYARVRELDMVATGYSPYEGSSSGRCATGMRAGYGVVAVDPRVIPLGSRLYIEGYGYAIAGDTGGAIRHNRIDLGMNTYRQANHVGRRRVHVYVLSEMR